MRSFWILFNIIFWTIVLGLLGIFVSLIERRGKFVGWVTRTWSKIILWSVAVTYSVKGLENLDPDEHYVFVANHESALDIPLAFALLPYHMVAITKKELKKIPIFGWVLAMSGFIFVDRSRHEKAMASLDAAAESLKNNPRSILLFPEGTRSTDGQIKTFKKGGLMLGAKAGLRVVPMACCGTGRYVKEKKP